MDRAQPHGELRIAVIGGGWAWVYIDGQKLDRTAPVARVPLRPGEHVVELVNEHTGVRERKTVHVAPGETTFVVSVIR